MQIKIPIRQIRQIRWIRRICWIDRVRRIRQIHRVRWIHWVRQVRCICRIRVYIRRIRVLKIALKIIHIFFKITLTKVSKANIYMYKQFYISFKMILNKRFLVFKTQGLYCHELIYCKWVNLQKKTDIKMKVRMKS